MNNKVCIAFLLVLSFTYLNVFAEGSPEKGKAIFTNQCTSCHNVNAQLVGPALADVDKRRTVDWLVSFIRSPKTLIIKKDKDAVALYNQYNQVIMPDHQDITADDVKNVLAYIKSETKTSLAEKAPFARPGKLITNYHPLNSYNFFISYVFLVGILVMLLVLAVHVKELQRNASAK